jgi:V-type H+-transporting ATPase subunit a
VETIR